MGCVITLGDRVVGRGRNRREVGKSALAHAEIEAIGEACRTLGGWRLWQCTLYVTLEPCPMCAGAIINARIPRVVYGASDPKAGCCASVVDLFALPFNHRPQVEAGLLEAESRALLQAFFSPCGKSADKRKLPLMYKKSTPKGGLRLSIISLKMSETEQRGMCAGGKKPPARSIRVGFFNFFKVKKSFSAWRNDVFATLDFLHQPMKSILSAQTR